MLHTNNPIIKHKAGLLNLAEGLGNVSKACKIMGVSRDTFYRYQELAEEGYIDALYGRIIETGAEIAGLSEYAPLVPHQSTAEEKFI